MALVIRRYLARGPIDAELTPIVPTAAVQQKCSGCIDVQVDDSIAGMVETLDEEMQVNGYTFAEQGPATQTDLVLVSPDGTRFLISVANNGQIAVNAEA